MSQTDDEMRNLQPENSGQPTDEQEKVLPKIQRKSTFEQIKSQVSEDDDAPVSSLTFRTILGGDILSAQMVRRQVWLLLLIMLFVIVSVAFRYQCQQDEIQISKMEQELTDIKYRTLSSSSNLTERTRESRVLEALRNSKDSVLQVSKQPPFIINVE
jgi:hypothetical protein